MSFAKIFKQANLLTMEDANDLGWIEDGVLATDTSGNVAWVGTQSQLEHQEKKRAQHAEVYNLRGKLITPGLIDCHTHLIYGGSRHDEWERRLQGASYEQIAREGGGIRSTVAATRAASFEELLSAAKKRARRMLRQGVTTLEVKSGYGLDLETERKMLQVANELKNGADQEIAVTFLGTAYDSAGVRSGPPWICPAGN